MQSHTCDERCAQCAAAAALSAHLPSCRAQRSLSALLAMSTELHAAIAACMASRRSMTSHPCEYNGVFYLHCTPASACIKACWVLLFRMQVG